MCSPFEAAIHEYVKGRLVSEDLRRLQLHFQLCGVCRHEANVLRWRSMESGTAELPPLPKAAEESAPATAQQRAQTVQRPPMSVSRALIIGAALGLGLTLLLAPFVPSVFSVEHTQSNIEWRHLNGKLPQDQARARKPGIRARYTPANPKPTEPITMKLLTDDPDIVIHWTVE